MNPGEKFELMFKNVLERLFVDRMDQNEDIFVRFMNDIPFQKVVTTWMADEAYRRLRAQELPIVEITGPRGLRLVKPGRDERYTSCVPLVPLKAAAGAFGDPHTIVDEEFEWVEPAARNRLRKGMFGAQVVGKSMEPLIPDGAYCLFAAPVTGTRQGKTVLVQLRDRADPETGQRYTVKRYDSAKEQSSDSGDSWHHTRITLKPINPAFAPIVLTGPDPGELQVIAELIEVLGTDPEHRSAGGQLPSLPTALISYCRTSDDSTGTGCVVGSPASSRARRWASRCAASDALSAHRS